MSVRLNFLCLSPNAEVLQRCQLLAKESDYSFLSFPSALEALPLKDKFEFIQFILLDLSHIHEKENLPHSVNLLRKTFKESFICTVLDPQIADADAKAVKSAGANLVMKQTGVVRTSRLEYVSSQVIRASFVPVKLADFPRDCVLEFTLFHLMTLNQKLVAILPKGSPLTENRIKKLEDVTEVFIRRDEIDLYRNYVETHPDSSEKGLKSRCRARFLSFANAHTQLMFWLMDEAEKSSYKEAKWLLGRCEFAAKDLLPSVSSTAESWEIINASSIGEFGSLERAPTVAAYAGLLSLLATWGEPLESMIGALLADFGILELPPAITAKMKYLSNPVQLADADYEEYKKHPAASVELFEALNFRLSDRTKEIILATHERADGQGFPKGILEEQIPPEAMAIQFSEKIDRTAMIRIGQPRIPVKDVRRELWENELSEGLRFSKAFLEKIKPVI